MRRIALVFAIICINISAIYAQQQPYDVSLISKNLMPYASAVVRNDEVSIEVKDLNNTIYRVKKAITILNKNGDVFANISVYHDDIQSIKNIKGATYNSFGIQTGKFSESAFEEDNTTDGFSLFEDTKVKHYTPHIIDYPYTIEYEYEIRIKGTLAFPDWRPNSGTGIAVEKSTFKFTCKPDFNIRYKEINIPTSAAIQTVNDVKTYTWQVNNLKAVKYEPFNPNAINYLSFVKIAPEKFTYYDIPGSFTDWNELGKWIYDNLVSNRQTLSDETKARMIELTKDISDPKLKAKKIYEYVQGKTHYISVQVGIGGCQPFLASDVDRLNYGDCKALVNYTQALLKTVGIESYYCIVEANEYNEHKVSMLSDFASLNQGNHIILCLPFKNDTTWCDCTSQTIPFGYLGSFTDDRNVLACTSQGGKLLHTPKYNTILTRKANFTVNNDGDLSGEMNTVYSGVDYTNRENVILESPVERLKLMQNIYPINNLTIEELSFKQNKSLNPSTTESMKIKAPEFASMDNGKINFSINPVSRIVSVPNMVFNRTTDVYINESFTNDDEYIYTIPTGYHLEGKVLHRVIDKPFGQYVATMRIVGNTLIYNRKFELKDGTYPKEMYQDVVDFYQSAADGDAHNVILVKD